MTLKDTAYVVLIITFNFLDANAVSPRKNVLVKELLCCIVQNPQPSNHVALGENPITLMLHTQHPLEGKAEIFPSRKCKVEY